MGTQKYDRDNTVHVSLKLNKKTDSDIINLLDAVCNKQGFLKHIIRAYDGSTGALHKEQVEQIKLGGQQNDRKR